MIPTFILAIENDDDRAFIEHIYKKYYNLMYSKAYDILQHRDCVDDVINNACIKLILKIQKLRTFNCCVLASYIVYTVRSAAIDYMRKENIASSWLSIDDETQDNILEDKDTPDELFIEKEKIERLLKALEKLPEKQRLILQLKYFCDMSDKEIAEVFNISPHSIRAYLSRARKVLYKIIEKDIILIALMLLSIMSVAVSAAAVYNVNNSDPTFTVMGSLQGAKDGNYYIWEYGTIRVDANSGSPSYTKFEVTIRLYANNNRVDSGEVNKYLLNINNYVGTNTYTFPYGTVIGLSATHLAQSLDGRQFNPTPALYLN